MKIVKCKQRWEIDSRTIKKTIGLVVGTSTSLYCLFHKYCALTRQLIFMTDPSPKFRPLGLLFFRIMRGFYSCDGCSYRQGTLTPLDNWTRPILDLHIFFFLRGAAVAKWLSSWTIKKTIGLVVGTSTSLYCLFHKYCALTRQLIFMTDPSPKFRPLGLLFFRIMRGFYSCDGCSYRQGTLTPLDNWTRPILDLHIFYFLRGAAVAKWLSSWLAEQEVRFPARHFYFQTQVITCVQVAIWLKYHWSDGNLPIYLLRPMLFRNLLIQPYGLSLLPDGRNQVSSF